jgi:hypothetical protein
MSHDEVLEAKVRSRLVQVGATRVSLSLVLHVTTFGPESVREAVYAEEQRLGAAYPDVQFDFHFHVTE